MLLGVPASHVPQVWHVVGPMLDRAIVRSDGDYSLDDVFGWVMARDWQLWVWVGPDGISCAAVTTIVTYPNRKVCCMPLIAGKNVGDWWLNGQSEMAEWARSQGCDRMEGYDIRAARGRAPWTRVVPGWAPKWMVIRRDL